MGYQVTTAEVTRENLTRYLHLMANYRPAE